MVPEYIYCPDCGAQTVRVAIRDRRDRVTLDAEPVEGGTWRIYHDRDTGDADAVLRGGWPGTMLHRQHSYSCTAAFTLDGERSDGR